MVQNKFSELIFSEDDVCDLLMQGRTIESLKNMIVDRTVDLEKTALLLDCIPGFAPDLKQQKFHNCSVPEFHQLQRLNWHMPNEYKQMDIAAYVLSLCTNEAELQRCGHELLLFQERDLFDLLKFLKYLVDTMTANHIIWGVGRGSSVASYVLYKLGIHRIDSMFYELNIEEFLR